MVIFFHFFLVNIGKDTFFYDILERKNSFLVYKNKMLKKSKIWHFSKGFWSINFSMVLVQKWLFFQTFFLGNIGQENVFYDILQRRNSFLGYKNKKFKKSKNWHFFKGVNPFFWSKNGHFFPLFFLVKIGKDTFFYDNLERKNSFLVYKNKRLKKSTNWHF